MTEKLCVWGGSEWTEAEGEEKRSTKEERAGRPMTSEGHRAIDAERRGGVERRKRCRQQTQGRERESQRQIERD